MAAPGHDRLKSALVVPFYLRYAVAQILWQFLIRWTVTHPVRWPTEKHEISNDPVFARPDSQTADMLPDGWPSSGAMSRLVMLKAVEALRAFCELRRGKVSGGLQTILEARQVVGAGNIFF